MIKKLEGRGGGFGVPHHHFEMWINIGIKKMN